MLTIAGYPLYDCCWCGSRIWRRLDNGWECGRCPGAAERLAEWFELVGEPGPEGIRPIERKVSPVSAHLGPAETIAACRRAFFDSLRPVAVG